MKKILIVFFLLTSILSARAQRELISDRKIRFSENLDPSKCEKERDNKTAMALLHIAIPGLDAANITEENNFIKGTPVKTNDGWDLWITTNTKKAVCLKIYTDDYKPLVIKAQTKLESAKKYVLTAKTPKNDPNVGKVYVLVNVNQPCVFTINKAGNVVERITFTENKKDTILHLPYGKYVYSAKAQNRFEDQGPIVLTDEPIEQSIILRSDMAKLRLFSEKESRLKIDGEEQVAVGDTIVIDKNVGRKLYSLYEKPFKIGTTHNIDAKSYGGEYKQSVRIKEGVNEIDMHIFGSLEITKPKNAYINIKKNKNKVSFDKDRLLTSALGTYEVSYSKYGYEPITAYYTVGVRENVKKGIKLKRTIAAFRFLNYTYSPTAPIGLMLGYAKRWGVYASLKTSSQFWKSFSIELGDGMVVGHDDDYATSVKNSVLPEEWHNYYVDPNKLEKKEPYRFSASIGIMKSIAWWLYIYAGAGYGRYKTLYENPNPLISEKRYDDAPDNETYYKDRFFSTYDLKGLELDGGIMIHHTLFNITAGWSHLIGTPSFGDFNVGIGFNIHGKE